jgi:hypothetical protein
MGGGRVNRKKNTKLPAKKEVSIVRSSAAEYLTFVAATEIRLSERKEAASSGAPRAPEEHQQPQSLT